MQGTIAKTNSFNNLLDISIIKDLSNCELVSITKEKLVSLELLKDSIPTLIEKAIQDYKKAKLKMLHDKDKQNPAGVNARVKKYNEKNKEKIKAKRNIKRNIVSIAVPFVENESIVLKGDDEFVIRF